MAKSKNIKWRDKCDRVITEIFTGQPCFICKLSGMANTTNTVGHHCVNRSLSAYYRHCIENIIPLCPTHHTMGVEVAAHSAYPPAQTAFVQLLRMYRKPTYDILMDYKRFAGTKVDYEKRYHELVSIRDTAPFGEDLM